ncbi:MAG: universal stress protein [Candidatus Hydrogenedentes bacterium]|nr:universal stress protein [Candidatus Hydrogenedentota bacterium]
MTKRILIPTDGSDYASIGVRYAVALAKRFNAALLGLHVVDIRLLEGPFLRDISASLGTAPYVNYQGNISMILEERGQAALDAFRHTCEEADVPCETVQATGVVVRCIVEKSELADMIVMGRGGEHSQWLDGLVGSTTAGVVRGAKQPVLVTGVDTPGTKRCLIAYDGSVHAKRALQAAASIAADWRLACHVLVVGDAKATPLLDEARAYLVTHDVKAECVLRGGDPSETIVAYAKECAADLLIMGAYGHTKVRELVVGSTTAYTLNHASCPLLMSR